jgi:N-acetyl-gamma-glutamyl-phosphate reductase
MHTEVPKESFSAAFSPVFILSVLPAPIFCPIVSDFYSGMMVTVPIFASQLKEGITVEDIKRLYADKYDTSLVKYVESIDDGGLISAAKLKMKDSMAVTVAGNAERILLIAVYNNLGKGASGAAIQCMNLVLGINETTGLNV